MRSRMFGLFQVLVSFHNTLFFSSDSLTIRSIEWVRKFPYLSYELEYIIYEYNLCLCLQNFIQGRESLVDCT